VIGLGDELHVGREEDSPNRRGARHRWSAGKPEPAAGDWSGVQLAAEQPDPFAHDQQINDLLAILAKHD
jgi:hypothetical protein